MRRREFPVQRFHIFIAIALLVKLALMGLFSSDYQNQMFMPFVGGFLDQIAKGNWINPYEFFKDTPGLFPYPPLMLAIECVGGSLCKLAGGSLFVSNLLFKLPNLIFDCLGMRFLMAMFPGKRRQVAILYFASPIIAYSTYMHGQLDIIPTTFLLGAIYYLTSSERRSDARYVLLIAAALCCKLHILAVLPILFLYTAKRVDWMHALKLLSLSLGLTVCCILPFWGEGFLENVLFNNDQSVLVRVLFDFGSVKIYIPIMAVLLIYLKVFTISRINKDLLYSLCGILFSVFLVLVPPMPGWYVWIVPFVTIFFIDVNQDRSHHLAVFIALNLAYLAYFLFAHRTSHVDLYFLTDSMMWMKTENELLRNGLFTLLTSTLVYSIYMMYQSGVVSNALYKRRNQPFAIGVAGDSGSGKSTFTSMVETIFGRKNLLFIEGDGDHRWERGDAMWQRFTHLNPRSNYLYRQAQDLAKLKTGESVVRVEYDHDTGKFMQQSRVKSRAYILLCGLHALYLPQVRSNLDLKIYMDVDETLRRYWKIRRDTTERGYSVQRILEQIEARMPDAQKYIYPQKEYADLIISYFDKGLADCTAQEHDVTLSMKITLDMRLDMEPLIECVTRYGGGPVSYDYDENLKMQSLVFDGESLKGRNLPIAEIANQLIPHLDELIDHPLQAQDDLHGVLSIVLLMMIGRKLQGEDSRD